MKTRKPMTIMNMVQNQRGDNLLSYYGDFMVIITQMITLSSYIFILINFRVWLVLVIMVIPKIINNLYKREKYIINSIILNIYNINFYHYF